MSAQICANCGQPNDDRCVSCGAPLREVLSDGQASGQVVLSAEQLRRFVHHVIMLGTAASRERDYLRYLNWNLERITAIALWETGLGPDPGPSPHPRDAAQGGAG